MANSGIPSASTGGTSSSSFPSSAASADTSGKIDRAAQAAHDTVDRLVDKTEPVRERLHERVESAATTVKSKVDRLDSLQDAWLTSARDCVREHPLASVLAGVAAGMLLERLSRRY